MIPRPNVAARRTVCLIAFSFWLAAGLLAQAPALEEGRTRFRAVDIFIDSRTTPLAAYQIHFAVSNAAAKIVGIEGGEPRPFREPPFHDLKAIQNERVIIAAFSTAPAAELPSGLIRVATIHLQVAGDTTPEFELKLQTAADPQGNRFSAEARCQERKSP
jgi:hypothetical protein